MAGKILFIWKLQYRFDLVSSGMTRTKKERNRNTTQMLDRVSPFKHVFSLCDALWISVRGEPPVRLRLLRLAPTVHTLTIQSTQRHCKSKPTWLHSSSHIITAPLCDPTQSIASALRFQFGSVALRIQDALLLLPVQRTRRMVLWRRRHQRTRLNFRGL